MSLTPETRRALASAERAFQKSAARTEQLREQRNEVVADAIRAGATHAEIAQATGLTRGRIGQIATSRLVAILVTMTAALAALAAPAGAWVTVAPDDARLARFLPIARAAWPASPCAGRETVNLDADIALTAMDQVDHVESSGRADASTCTIWIKSGLDDADFCTTLVHEDGHLAGLGHSHDGSVMDPDGGFYAPCVYSNWRSYAWRDLPRAEPWRLSCTRLFNHWRGRCRAEAPGAHTRRVRITIWPDGRIERDWTETDAHR